MSSNRVFFLLKKLCCVCRISCFISIGFVSMLPLVDLRQSNGVFMDGLNIYLHVFLGLVFSMSLYFVMVFFAIDGGLFGNEFAGF